jgi:hypothetical protein
VERVHVAQPRHQSAADDTIDEPVYVMSVDQLNTPLSYQFPQLQRSEIVFAVAAQSRNGDQIHTMIEHLAADDTVLFQIAGGDFELRTIEISRKVRRHLFGSADMQG